jgi:hypothetical protein
VGRERQETGRVKEKKKKKRKRERESTTKRQILNDPGNDLILQQP